MSLAIEKEKINELKQLAKKHDVEVSIVGEFTASGKFHVLFRDVTVAYLDMKFLHEGVPQMKLKATWTEKIFPEPVITETSLSEIMKKLLACPNIASKETIVRRFDHEVKAFSVVKPFMRGPTNGGVLKPIFSSYEGLVISHGICPKFIQDTKEMTALAFDEAVRNALATGAKFGYLAALDNFSWPDPLPSPSNPEAEYKLAQLVRSCIALYDYATAYGIPFISGKDSMKNDYVIGDERHSILPTLLITLVGKIDDIRKAVTPDFKNPGDYIYVLGKARDELGGSEYYKLFNGVGNTIPKVRNDENIPLYRALSHATDEKLIASCHDISDGGMAIALCESSFGSGYGADFDMGFMPKETEKEDVLLFAENPGRFIVSVKAEQVEKFEKCFAGTVFGKVGRVRGDKRLIIRKGEEILINEDTSDLKQIWAKGI